MMGQKLEHIVCSCRAPKTDDCLCRVPPEKFGLEFQDPQKHSASFFNCKMHGNSKGKKKKNLSILLLYIDENSKCKDVRLIPHFWQTKNVRAHKSYQLKIVLKLVNDACFQEYALSTYSVSK
jgi:hypothetical protein